MVANLASRLALALVTLAGVGIVVFVLLRVAPGDPIAMMISPGATPEDVAALRARYGLDTGIVTQFFIWAKSVLSGDFGTSISLKRDVLTLLAERLPATLELAMAALVVAVILGGIVAIIGSLFRGSRFEGLVDVLNGSFLAVPDFIWALAFVLLFGVAWPLFPTSGRINPDFAGDLSTRFYLTEALLTLKFRIFFDVLLHMVMPVMALALPLASVIVRILKEALLEALVQDYILLARLKGFSKLRLVVQEALRNAVGPTIALTGVQFTFLIGGTVIVERIFAYPGIGNMAIDAVINRDLPLIQGLVLTFGAIFILVNLAVDALAVVVNPRLRHG